MVRQVLFMTLALLAVPFQAFANPFAGGAVQSKLDTKCKYSEVYSAIQETYLMLNVVSKLALKKDELSRSAEAAFSKVVDEVLTDCGSSSNIRTSDVLFQNGVLTFLYGSRPHSIEWLSKSATEYVVYKKLYGTYKDEPLMVMQHRDQKLIFTRITGRLGEEASNKRYTFFYKGDDSVASSQTVLNNKNVKSLKSLRSIYGESLAPLEPLIKVGVIGTGLDYNHPGLAKHLAYRPEMEKKLQTLELLESNLRLNPYISESEYRESAFAFEKLKPQLGFPLWMDQALGTNQPLDSVIINQKISRGSTREHETRVTSRIIRNGGPVEIHFARRSMGSMDILNVHQVIDHFAESGVSLVNLSFGSKCGGFPLEEQMWDEVFAKYPEIVFVVSAGNSGFDTAQTPFCPANYSEKYKNVISVTALGTDGGLATYFEKAVNFGNAVDLAIRADNLEVLIPYKKTLRWENNANGATSLAAAEVSRILTEAVLDGLVWSAQTVKAVLMETSLVRPDLKRVNKQSSEVDEWAFRKALSKVKNKAL